MIQINGKRKGNRAEHRTMQLLELSGFRCVRSAGSYGPIDVVGVSNTHIMLVQVKSGGGYLPPAEREALQEFPCPSNGNVLLHVWSDRVRTPRVEVIK